MARYLEYHAGEYGYGIRKQAVSLPLITGTTTHACLEGILRAYKASGRPPGEDVVSEVIHKQIGAYKRTCETRGFTDLLPDQKAVVEEQAYLIAALTWGWFRTSFPKLVEEFNILEIEQEETLTINGVSMMCRPDVLLEHKGTGRLRIRDFKTAVAFRDKDIEEYRNSVQMAVGTLAVEQRLGRPVEEYELDVLLKGSRRTEYNPGSGDYDGPKRQQSPLVYAYFKPGNPPITPDDWQPQWRYTGPDGKKHTLGRGYEKTFLGAVFKPKEWVYRLPMGLLYDQFLIVGPYQRQQHMLLQWQQSMVAEEKRWAERLWKLYEAETTYGWASEKFQEILSQTIPRSYLCFGRYGSKCQFWDICFKMPGWDTLAGYVPRRPHHEPEIQQMEDRGIPVPPAEDQDIEADVESV